MIYGRCEVAGWLVGFKEVSVEALGVDILIVNSGRELSSQKIASFYPFHLLLLSYPFLYVICMLVVSFA